MTPASTDRRQHELAIGVASTLLNGEQVQVCEWTGGTIFLLLLLLLWT